MDILNRKAILDRVEKSIIGDDGISDIEKNINILNSMVFKGRKPAQVGEIREWARGKMIRTPDGWEPYKEGDSTGKESEQEEPDEADKLEDSSKKLMDDKVMDLIDEGVITIEDLDNMSDEELNQMLSDKANMMDEMENPENESLQGNMSSDYSPEVSNLAWDKEFRDNVINTLKDTIGEEEFNKMSSEEIADYVLDSANEFLEQENGVDNKESDEESKDNSEQIYEHGSNDEESYQRLLDEGFTPEFIKDSGIAPSQLLDEFYKDSGAYDEIKAINEEESSDLDDLEDAFKAGDGDIHDIIDDIKIPKDELDIELINNAIMSGSFGARELVEAINDRMIGIKEPKDLSQIKMLPEGSNVKFNPATIESAYDKLYEYGVKLDPDATDQEIATSYNKMIIDKMINELEDYGVDMQGVESNEAVIQSYKDMIKDKS